MHSGVSFFAGVAIGARMIQQFLYQDGNLQNDQKGFLICAFFTALYVAIRAPQEERIPNTFALTFGIAIGTALSLSIHKLFSAEDYSS